MSQHMRKNQARMEKQPNVETNPVNNPFYRVPVNWASSVDNTKGMNQSEAFSNSAMEGNPVNNAFFRVPASWAASMDNSKVPINQSEAFSSSALQDIECNAVYNHYARVPVNWASVDNPSKRTLNHSEAIACSALRSMAGNPVSNTASRVPVSWASSIDNRKINIKQPAAFTSGALHELPADASPVEYFRLFLTDDMIRIILLNTNRSITSHQNTGKKDKKKDKVIQSEEEIVNFICILLIMGICHLPEIHSYWSENPILGNQMVKTLMSRDRFFAIMRHFCLSHAETEKEGLYGRVRPFMSDFKTNFMKYFSPFKELSICENNISYNSKSFLEKPTSNKKKGIKVWMLHDFKTGYVYSFEPYSGRQLSMDGKGLENDVVLQLCSGLKNAGHYIFLNRYLASVPLMLDLLDMGHYSIGFICKNKPNLPEGLKEEDSETCKLYQCNESPNLTCLLFRHKGEKVVVSTGHVHAMDTMKEFKAPVLYPCPKTVKVCINLLKKYNDSGRTREIYVNRRFNKYWLSAFLFLMKTSMSNANILYNLAYRPGGKPMSLLDFSLSVIASLKTFTRPIVMNDCLKKDIVMKKLRSAGIDKHKVVKITGRRKTCKHCRELKVQTASNRPVESSWMCSICEVCLCKKCFDPYHKLLFETNSSVVDLNQKTS